MIFSSWALHLFYGAWLSDFVAFAPLLVAAAAPVGLAGPLLRAVFPREVLPALLLLDVEGAADQAAAAIPPDGVAGA